MNFPKTKREEVTDEPFGIKVSDPYRWLENANSEEVKEWIDAQNNHTDEILRNETYETFSGELIRNFKVATFSNPFPIKGKYFYYERQPDEDQNAFYMKVGIDGVPIKLVDPNGMNVDNTISLDYCFVSRTGKYLVYGLSEGGDEMASLHIKDTDNNKDLDEKIPRCRYSEVRWLPNDSGFFYTRNPKVGTISKNEEYLHTKVYFHRIGDDPKDDELIFGKDRPKEDDIELTLSLDGKYLAVSASQNWTENDIYIYETKTKKTTLLIVGINAKFFVFFTKDKVIIRTNYKANNYRVLSVPIESIFTGVDEWEEIIPEREYLLESLYQTKDKILAEYRVNACSKVEIFDHNGKRQNEIPLPPYSTIEDISTNLEEREFFYGVISFTHTKTIYRYIPDENKFIEYRKINNPIIPDKYIVKQEWCISKDGTKIPMFIVHKKDISKTVPHPTILYGYGGFGSVEGPNFDTGFAPWMERGGIFAVANIRGGGEFGEEWHRQGIKENKQNSFDDFIATAEYLIKQGYTDSKHLGILGDSNGGLLVSAVAIQRPDLFGAVCSMVPLTDMVRFSLFGMALLWLEEYGDPKNKEDLKNILKWSPYHNVKESTEYPALFFTTAEKDSRVDPLHSRKMTAMLQSINEKNDILLFTEKEAGHGSDDKPIKKIIESQAYILAFFAKNLGLSV
ncbi:MAG: prolyl oligopeptidase family serine peptidase [Patescibacteria group bacterium]